jgi:hypothetical protein
LIPQEEWETKSIIWTPVNSGAVTGTQTPMPLAAWPPHTPSMSTRGILFSYSGVDEVMHDTHILNSEKLYMNEKPKLESLDSQLELMSQSPRVTFN